MMEDYYRKRASEYEKIYHRDDPVRLKEQRKIAEKIKNLFNNKIVLEIAAGTGYWTQFLSETASKIIATDYVEETLELAKTKNYKCSIEFKKEDAYNLSFKDNEFSAGMANFWFSHIPKDRINEFFNEFHRVMNEGSIVFLADNAFDKTVGGELIKVKGNDNTYKLRGLSNGSKHQILKNYYSKKELFDIFDKFSDKFSDTNIFYGKKFWYVFYNLNKFKVLSC